MVPTWDASEHLQSSFRDLTKQHGATQVCCVSCGWRAGAHARSELVGCIYNAACISASAQTSQSALCSRTAGMDRATWTAATQARVYSNDVRSEVRSMFARSRKEKRRCTARHRGSCNMSRTSYGTGFLAGACERPEQRARRFLTFCGLPLATLLAYVRGMSRFRFGISQQTWRDGEVGKK